jgi:hypothetical protein
MAMNLRSRSSRVRSPFCASRKVAALNVAGRGFTDGLAVVGASADNTASEANSADADMIFLLQKAFFVSSPAERLRFGVAKSSPLVCARNFSR